MPYGLPLDLGATLPPEVMQEAAVVAASRHEKRKNETFHVVILLSKSGRRESGFKNGMNRGLKQSKEKNCTRDTKPVVSRFGL